MSENGQWTVDVKGMTCDACEEHVTQALESVGADDIVVSWRAGTAVFSAAEVDEDGVANAVRDAGYEASGIRLVQPLERAARRDDVDWDLAIIGSGSAGFAAAIKATESGARVVMVEKATPGGTCVNIGCVPSKALLVAAEMYHKERTHEFAGIPRLDDSAPDLAAVVAQKDELVHALRQAKYIDLVDDYGFDFRTGTARFVDASTIEIDGEPLTAANFLIATGATPSAPPIDGLDTIDYLTSTTALDLTEIPGRLAVIGANAIGLELGQAFSRLGSEVTFLDIADRIAPFEEPEISAMMEEILVTSGSQVVTGARISRVQRTVSGVSLQGELGDIGSTLEVDRVLVATGRGPNTRDLDLDAAGVKVDEHGFVIVDETLRTTNPSVWAAGDVTSSPQFVYVSASEGAMVADNAISGAGRRTDYRTLPRVTFTTPQIAAVGLTEAQAEGEGHNVVTSVLPLAYVPRAIVNRDTHGLIKLVADADTDLLLGVHVLADGGGEIIQAGVYALVAKLTTGEIAGTFHAYLTMAEGLKLAAQTFNRDVTKLSCCAA